MTKTNIAGAISATKLKASLGQSLLSFIFDIVGLLTGAILIRYFDIFSISEAPWAILLFPGILGARGAVGGLFSGHLGTGLHLGTIKATFTQNTKNFHLLLRVVITLAFVSGISVGTGSWIFGVFLWNATFIDFVQLLAVITATMALSVMFVSPLTMGFSVLSFRRGLDPDIIVYPITSTMSDIINTCCYILSLSLFFMFKNFGRYLILIVDIIFIAFVVYILVKNVNETNFARTIREFLLTLALITFIVNVTGSFLTKISGTRIYSVYPAVITTIGGVGSIIGSTATTKLALGLIRPSFSSIRMHIPEIGGAWIASIVMFLVYAIVSSFISGVKTLGDIVIFIGQLLTTNILAVFLMIFIAYTIAIFSFRRGWNPDNFVIPIESSLADTITTAAILVAMALIF
jgi:mgtE-like transporter